MQATRVSEIVHLHARDSVVVALKNFAAGQQITVGDQVVTLRDAVPAGHKVAIREIATDQPVIKFGWAIGTATAKIEPGQHVHTHNLRDNHTIDLAAISTEIPDDPSRLVSTLSRDFDDHPVKLERAIIWL